jgi:hypothetical protein
VRSLLSGVLILCVVLLTLLGVRTLLGMVWHGCLTTKKAGTVRM